MTAASTSRSLRRRLGRRAAVRIVGRPAASDGVNRVEIVAPDAACAALLLEYASLVFPGEVVSCAPSVIRVEPPSTGPGWVIDLLALVERWLDSVPLPCATVLYGGRTYLVRSSARVARFVVARPAGPASD